MKLRRIWIPEIDVGALPLETTSLLHLANSIPNRGASETARAPHSQVVHAFELARKTRFPTATADHHIQKEHAPHSALLVRLPQVDLDPIGTGPRIEPTVTSAIGHQRGLPTDMHQKTATIRQQPVPQGGGPERISMTRTSTHARTIGEIKTLRPIDVVRLRPHFPTLQRHLVPVIVTKIPCRAKGSEQVSKLVLLNARLAGGWATTIKTMPAVMSARIELEMPAMKPQIGTEIGGVRLKPAASVHHRLETADREQHLGQVVRMMNQTEATFFCANLVSTLSTESSRQLGREEWIPTLSISAACVAAVGKQCGQDPDQIETQEQGITRTIGLPQRATVATHGKGMKQTLVGTSRLSQKQWR